MNEVRYHHGPSASQIRDREARRARLLDDMREIEAMTDADLDLEITAASKNIEDIAIDLKSEEEGVTKRGIHWKISAEKRLTSLRARRKLCGGELLRRNAAAKAERRAIEAAKAERAAKAGRTETLESRAERRAQNAATIAAAIAAKAERVEREAARKQTRQACFIRHAKAMLPPETFAALWAVVDGEMDDDRPLNGSAGRAA